MTTHVRRSLGLLVFSLTHILLAPQLVILCALVTGLSHLKGPLPGVDQLGNRKEYFRETKPAEHARLQQHNHKREDQEPDADTEVVGSHAGAASDAAWSSALRSSRH